MLLPIALTAILIYLSFGQQAPVGSAFTRSEFDAQGKPQDQTGNKQTPQENLSRLERAYRYLYNLVWPGGRYQGNLAEKVDTNIEKAGDIDVIPRLYLVNVQTGDFKEWATARGVVDFAISPDGKKLFYRRQTSLFMETLEVSDQDVVSLSAPKKVEGIEVSRLYACAQRGGQPLELWVESPQHVIRLVRINQDAASWSDLPKDNELASLDPYEVVKYLRHLRSLRSDGFYAQVRNSRLIGEKGSDKQTSSLVNSQPGSPAPKFYGAPAWVKDDSKFLMANGLREESKQ